MKTLSRICDLVAEIVRFMGCEVSSDRVAEAVKEVSKVSIGRGRSALSANEKRTFFTNWLDSRELGLSWV